MGRLHCIERNDFESLRTPNLQKVASLLLKLLLRPYLKVTLPYPRCSLRSQAISCLLFSTSSFPIPIHAASPVAVRPSLLASLLPNRSKCRTALSRPHGWPSIIQGGRSKVERSLVPSGVSVSAEIPPLYWMAGSRTHADYGRIRLEKDDVNSYFF